MATPIVALGTYCPYGIQKRDSSGNTYHGHAIEIPGNRVGDDNEYYHYHILDIAIDDSGFIYIATDSLTERGANGRNIVKLDPYGNLVWYANHGAPVGGIAIDENNNVYIYGASVNNDYEIYSGGLSGDRTGYYNVRKYDSSGILQWSIDVGYRYQETGLGGLIYGVYPIFYRNGYIYIGSYVYSSSIYKLKKYNASTGSLVWQALNSVSDTVYNIIVDDDDNVYVVGDFGNYFLHKFDSDGSLIASAETLEGLNGSAVGRSIVIDSAGDLIIACAPITYDYDTYDTFYKYDSDCILTETLGASLPNLQLLVNDLGIDADDYVYVAYDKGTGYDHLTWRKIAPDFSSFIWEYRTKNILGEDTSYDALCIAVKDIEIPPLPIKFDFGIPIIIGDLYTSIPSLPLYILLATPSLYRDYVGASLPSIYRAYLTGGTGTVEFIISNITIRRTINGLSIDVIIPSAVESDIDKIESRTSGNIIIYRGIRFTNNSEQLDELINVPFDNFRYDGGSQSASITLSGYGEYESTHAGNRNLYGISYRNTTNGLRRVRCLIDTYLRVGDIANLGNDETMTVSEITITIDTTNAIMEVAE